MTISYTSEVPNASSFGCFWKILWKWRGSVYKLVWRELVAYLLLYYLINFVYRYALTVSQKEIFDKIKAYSTKQLETIPMSFVLGFYVSLVVNRWWTQYKLLPWPDTLALFISAAIPNNSGSGETGRLMRRNIMRYMILAYVITLQRISLRVKRRFPSVQHLVDAGLMMESERKIFETLNARSPMSKYWMPLVWATNIINRARKENLITSDHIVQTILVELSDIRRRLGGLIGFDTVCVPLVYTQVVTLVLYTYFIAALFGRQMTPHTADGGDLYFPIFTVLQFIFYVGWLKVAEVLINPFGEDDDDIELNWLIDRHIKAAYMIVDEMHEEHPELLKDQYWEEVVPKDLPYTVASEHYRKFEPKGSADHLKVKAADAVYANVISSRRSAHGLPEDVYADYESVDTPMVERRKNWIQRQFSRMGSVRSQSTAYSSGGIFNRNRINSVYSSPEAGLNIGNNNNNSNIGGGAGGGGGGGGSVTAQPPTHKLSFYEKFVNRKSIREQREQRRLSKQQSRFNINGSVLQTAPRTARPRIPTPDVTKESVEKENRLNLNIQTLGQNTGSVASGVALMTSQLANTPAMYQQNINSDVPVVGTLLLSPIKEIDTNSAHNTLQPGNPATAALAQSILPKSLQAAGFGSMSMSISHPGTPTEQLSPTFSFPYTDSIPATLSIIPQLTTTAGDNMFTSIPVSVSVPKSPTIGSVHDINALNRILALATPMLSRQSSLNLSPNMPQDSYIMGRNHSDRIKTNTLSNETMPFTKANSSSSLNKSTENSSSAPSTLTKQKPEPKTGEVYV